MFSKILTITTLTILHSQASVAQRPEVEMADGLRADGKIWVVVGVIAILFAGLFVYLINTDKKLRRIEKQMKEKQ